MFNFFVLLRDFWVSIIDLFDKHPLNIAGYEVSLFSLILVFLVFGFIISYFWKGART